MNKKKEREKPFSRREFLVAGGLLGTGLLFESSGCGKPDSVKELQEKEVITEGGSIFEQIKEEQTKEGQPPEKTKQEEVAHRDEKLASSEDASSTIETQELPEEQRIEEQKREEIVPDTGALFSPLQLTKNTLLSSLVVGGMQPTKAVFSGVFTKNEERTLSIWEKKEPLTQVQIVASSKVKPDKEGFSKIELDGLQPGKTYQYCYHDETERSTIAEFKTAPDAQDSPVLVIGASSCTKLGRGPFDSLKALAKEKLDFFIHTGDMVYQDDAKTKKQYQANWKSTLTEPGYVKLFHKTGMYITWDDHEFYNNPDPEKDPPGRIQIAKDTFFQALPVHHDKGKVWRSYRWGKTVEIFLLDCRTERIPSTRKTKDAIFIGKQQMAWLKKALKSSPCHFKLLMNSIPMTDMPLGYPSSPDRWEGSDAQREELLSYLDKEKIQRTFFVSGDFHFPFIANVDKDGKYKRFVEIAAGPGAQYLNPGVHLLPNSRFQYLGTSGKVGTIFTLDPKKNTIRVKYIDEKGKSLFDKDISV